MKYLAPTAIAMSLAAAAPALAQPSPEVFYSSGFVQLEHYDLDGENDDLLFLDGTIGFRADTGNSLIWGAELSAEALRIDGETYDILNATLFVDTVYGRFSAGTPKSVTDSYGARRRFNKTGISVLAGLSRLGGSLLRFYDFNGENEPWGVRYDHRIGNTEFGVSANRYKQGGANADFYGLAVRHQFDNYALFATYEAASGDIPDLDKFSIGGEADFGPLHGGISYGQSDVFVVNGLDIATLYVDYDILDRVTVGGEYFRLSTPAAKVDAYGLNVDYGFWRNAYVGASVIDGDFFGNDTLVAGRLGWKLDY